MIGVCLPYCSVLAGVLLLGAAILIAAADRLLRVVAYVNVCRVEIVCLLVGTWKQRGYLYRRAYVLLSSGECV